MLKHVKSSWQIKAGLLTVLLGAGLVAVWFLFFKPPENLTETDVFNSRFVHSLDKSIPLARPTMTSWGQLRKELTRLHVPFSALYSEKILEGVPQKFKNNIFSLKFKVGNTLSQTAYFYKFKTNAKNNCGVMIIPGTGFDQASKISRGKGYHGKIVDTIAPICDVHVLIKPNQGPLAIHNGDKALDHRIVRVTLINDGFSYSITYFSYAQAIMTYLRAKYKKTGIVGLSQGGEASLIISNLEHPNFAVVSSGYSTLNATIEYKDIKQTIAPGFRKLNKPENVREKIEQGNTKYLFTWGLRENRGYRLEAKTMKTCNYLKEKAENKVTCIAHSGKHVFPLNEVSTFIKNQVSQ